MSRVVLYVSKTLRWCLYGLALLTPVSAQRVPCQRSVPVLPSGSAGLGSAENVRTESGTSMGMVRCPAVTTPPKDQIALQERR